MSGGRISRLDDAEFAKLVAELYVKGVSHADMADELDCGKDTIRVWVKDPRVQAHTRRMAVERVNRISRKIDGEIEARLADIEGWSLDEVLKVRKEYLDRPLRVGAGEDVDMGKTSNEVAEAMDQSPEFALQLQELVAQAKAAQKH